MADGAPVDFSGWDMPQLNELAQAEKANIGIVDSAARLWRTLQNDVLPNAALALSGAALRVRDGWADPTYEAVFVPPIDQAVEEINTATVMAGAVPGPLNRVSTQISTTANEVARLYEEWMTLKQSIERATVWDYTQPGFAEGIAMAQMRMDRLREQAVEQLRLLANAYRDAIHPLQEAAGAATWSNPTAGDHRPSAPAGPGGPPGAPAAPGGPTMSAPSTPAMNDSGGAPPSQAPGGAPPGGPGGGPTGSQPTGADPGGGPADGPGGGPGGGPGSGPGEGLGEGSGGAPGGGPSGSGPLPEIPEGPGLSGTPVAPPPTLPPAAPDVPPPSGPGNGVPGPGNPGTLGPVGGAVPRVGGVGGLGGVGGVGDAADTAGRSTPQQAARPLSTPLGSAGHPPALPAQGTGTPANAPGAPGAMRGIPPMIPPMMPYGAGMSAGGGNRPGSGTGKPAGPARMRPAGPTPGVPAGLRGRAAAEGDRRAGRPVPAGRKRPDERRDAEILDSELWEVDQAAARPDPSTRRRARGTD